MKYEVEFLEKAVEEFEKLTIEQQELLTADYERIQNIGMEAVLTRPLGKKIYEIKTSNLRSLFKYAENRIIIIGLIYVKQSQKTPQEILKLANKRMKGI